LTGANSLPSFGDRADGRRLNVSETEAAARAASPLKRRVILIGVGIVLLVLGYFFAAAFLPRWWSHRVGSQSDGKFRGGVWWGLFYGILFTVLPLIVARQALRKRFSWKWKVGIVIGALILAAPNLMTLGIVLGNGKGAHAGQRTLDDQAPGFRGASLIGVLIAAVLLGGLQYLITSRRNRGRELKTVRERSRHTADGGDRGGND
jgi:hypothetical protein